MNGGPLRKEISLFLRNRVDGSRQTGKGTGFMPGVDQNPRIHSGGRKNGHRLKIDDFAQEKLRQRQGIDADIVESASAQMGIHQAALRV